MIDRRWYSAEVDVISCRKWPRIRKSRIRKEDDWTEGTWSKNGRGTIGCGTWPRNTWLTRSSSRASIHEKWTICWVTNENMFLRFLHFLQKERKKRFIKSKNRFKNSQYWKVIVFVTTKRFVLKKYNSIKVSFFQYLILLISYRSATESCVRWKFLPSNYELKYEKKKKKQ